MSTKPQPSTISDDGLRYRDRQPNTLFPAVTTSSGMSCYWCSTHRGHSSLSFQKILGKSQRVCSPPCSKNQFARNREVATT
jgi:hypothetical protein